NYFLYGHNTATGPELTYQGSAVTDGQFGSVIGAEAVAGGYEVVWHNNANDSYTAWNVDSSGNYVSTLLGPVTELNAAFPSLEAALQQDLNTDGWIGTPPPITPIESFGSTTATKVGDHYYLFANGTSSGPELRFGNPVPVGFFGTMIGAEQV